MRVRLRLGQNLKTAVTQYLVGNMSSVVFLRGINVGGANLCRPALLAKQLARFSVVNIGAVGTFVVRENVSESALRKAVAAQLAKDFGVTCEIMICPARGIVRLTSKDPFAGKPFGADVNNFGLSVPAKFSMQQVQSRASWRLAHPRHGRCKIAVTPL